MTATNPSENSRSEDCLIINFSFKLAITSGFTIQGLEKRDELCVICLGLPLGSTISPRWMVLLYKLANLFVSHFGVVIKQKMRARGDLANLDVARAQPGQVRKGSVLFSKKEETRYRQVEEFFQQPPGIGFCDRLETVGMVRAHVSIQCHVVSGHMIACILRSAQLGYNPVEERLRKLIHSAGCRLPRKHAILRSQIPLDIDKTPKTGYAVAPEEQER